MQATIFEGRSIPCPRCGGLFAVGDLAGALDCPYCAHRFALDAAALGELERYQVAVHAALGHADEHHQHAAAWQWAERQSRLSTPKVLIGFGVVVGLLVLMAGGIQVGLMSGALTAAVIPWFSIGSVGSVLLAAIGYSVWSAVRGRTKSERAHVGATRVACPSCGAPSELHGAQTHETCSHCRAALMPSATAMHRVVDRARLEARAAEMQRFRAERRGMAAVTSRGAGAILPYLVLGPFLLMTGIPALIAIGEVVMGEGNLRAAFALTVLAALNAGLLVAIHAWRKSWRQRWRRVVDDLARQFRGRTADEPLAAVVHWLDAYWASPYELVRLHSGSYHAAAMVDACGYPALIDIDPVSRSAPAYPARIQMVIAATVAVEVVERRAPLSAAAQASLHWLEAAGFAIATESSGVIASASERTLAHLRRQPEAAHELSTVITTLAGLAHALGAPPATPIP